MNDPLTEKKTRRFRFLNALYEKTDGNEDEHVNMWEIGAEIGLSKEETDQAAQYLVGEHLMEYAAMGGVVAITHFGVVQVEQALSNPEKPSEYFPPVINILNVGTMTGSQVQQGGAGSHFEGTLSDLNLDELRRLIRDIQAVLADPSASSDIRAELEPQVVTLNAQAGAARPNRLILREALGSARSVLEGMMGSLLASGLLPRINEWLARLG